MEEEKILKEATVCFLYKNGKVLLARKKKKIGKGCWNGYGGGVHSGESVEDCALRELNEETGGVTAQREHLEKIAVSNFHNTTSSGEAFTLTVHFFFVHEWKGEARETEEMSSPEWFATNDLPLKEMMPSDKDWLHLVLNGEKMIVDAYLGPYQKEVTAPTQIQIVETLH